MCLFRGFERDLYDLRRSIALAELLDVLHLAELQQNLVQLFEPDAGRHVADHYLVGAENDKTEQTVIEGRRGAGGECNIIVVGHGPRASVGRPRRKTNVVCAIVARKGARARDAACIATLPRAEVYPAARTVNYYRRHCCETTSPSSSAAVDAATAATATV